MNLFVHQAQSVVMIDIDLILDINCTPHVNIKASKILNFNECIGAPDHGHFQA
jgi:hypothetical protein